jgi:hypothetical protein
LSSSAHISFGKYVRTITFDRWLWPRTSLNAAVFRVSPYPRDGFFLPKPTQIVFQTTSALEVPTSAFQNRGVSRVILSKNPFLPCYWGALSGYLLGNISVTVNFEGLILIQGLSSLPSLLTRLRGNVRSCVSTLVESFFRPQNQLPGFYPLLHFFPIPAVRNRPGALEYWLAETVSQKFSLGNPLGLCNLFVPLPVKPLDQILSYCFVPSSEALSPNLWCLVKICNCGTPKVWKTDVSVLSLNVGPVQV